MNLIPHYIIIFKAFKILNILYIVMTDLFAPALHATSLAGHATTVKILLANGAHINMTDLQKHTPLFRACEMGHTDVVQTLIDCGAKVNL